MYKRSFTVNQKEYVRIDKRKARGLYDAGKDIIVCPENLRPFTFYHFETVINKAAAGGFTGFIDTYTIYNCVNKETGYRPAFYMEVK